MMKKAFLLAGALLGGLTLTLALALLVSRATPVRANPGILYVAPGGNCNGVSPCYGNVQAAVDVAIPGDIIKVAAGTYTDISARAGMTQVVYISKTVTIQGGYTTTNWTIPDPDANPTILDAQGQGRVLYITGAISPTIEGLRVTGGNAAKGGGGWGNGGGVYVAYVTKATISHCLVFSNAATGGGGGVLFWQVNGAILHGSTIVSNVATYAGGGVWLESSVVTLSDNIVSHNLANQWRGGGVYLQQNSDATFIGNLIRNNAAYAGGGGISLQDSNAVLLSNLICNNASYADGGGLRLDTSSARLDNNVVANNWAQDGEGDGVCVHSSIAHLRHTTLVHNTWRGSGSGIYVTGYGIASTVELTNTILVSQSVGIYATPNNTVAINSVLWFNNGANIGGTGTISVTNEIHGAPHFASDGYHITPASAAMDAGVDAGVTIDIDGHYRFYGSAPDLGADEIIATPIHPGTASTLVYTDTQGNPTLIQVPAGAVTTETVLVYTPVETVAVPSGFFFAGHAFDLDAYRGGVLLPGFTFSVPVTITIRYSNAAVAGLDEVSLALQTWNTNLGVWEDAACGSYDRHPDENWLAVPICHLSRFALFGKGYIVYLPLVVRNYQ